MIFFWAMGIGGGVILLMNWRHWVDSNNREMGSMSRQWLAEQDSSRR